MMTGYIENQLCLVDCKPYKEWSAAREDELRSGDEENNTNSNDAVFCDNPDGDQEKLEASCKSGIPRMLIDLCL